MAIPVRHVPVPDPIPMAQWRWFGCAGHFVGRWDCHFHLHTRIGDYRISTVGNWVRQGSTNARPVALGALYETMVFLVDGEADDGEGDYASDALVTAHTNTEPDAVAAHMDLCEKYAAVAAARAVLP